MTLTRFGAVALLLFGSACSGSGDDDTGTVSTAPIIDTFSVDRELVQSGESVKVTWKVRNATEVTVNESGKAPIVTPMTDASQDFVIIQDTTFELVAKNEKGEMATESLMVAVDGIRIDSFETSATSVNRREPVTLSWNIVGEAPTSITIDDDQGTNVYNGTEARGSVEVRPEQDVTYTITVVGMTGTKVATVMITVTSVRPTITSFQARPSNIIEIGENAQLFWETTADEVQILEDGTPVRPWNTAGAAAGNIQRRVSVSMVVFTLQARNSDDPTDVVEETITVMGLPTPQFVNFSITPVEYTEASTVATVTWEVTDADSLDLRIGNNSIAGFPTTQLSGTFDFTVSGEPNVRLLATNAVTTNVMSQTIRYGYNEDEPNDNRAQAIPIDADRVPVRGTITVAGDVDWYVFMVPQGSLLFARAGIVQVMGVDVCSFDTIIRVFDAQGTQIGVNDNGPVGVSPCSQVNPLVDTWAENMAAGTYYISVGGSGNMPIGQYSLEVGVSPPPVGLPVTPTRVGNPQWNLGGFVMWTAPIGAQGADIPVEVAGVLDPFHTFAGFATLSALTTPNQPHPRPDYSNLLPLFMAVAGRTVQTTYATTDLLDPNGIYIGYTIYPTGTSTGASFDRPSGPIVPNGLFPINIDLDVMKDGMVYSPVDPIQFPAYAQYATAGLPAVPNAGDGDSHRHLISIIADIVAAAPGGNLVGSYQWVYQLRDTTNAGYDVTVDFTVQ